MDNEQAYELTCAIGKVARSLGDSGAIDGSVADQLAQIGIAISDVADALNRIADAIGENNGH